MMGNIGVVKLQAPEDAVVGGGRKTTEQEAAFLPKPIRGMQWKLRAVIQRAA